MGNCKNICFLTLLFLITACSKKNSENIAWVNNEVITKSEIRHWMLLEKANVYNYFYRKFGVDDSKDFWTQKLGDEIPLKTLKEIALKKVQRCKVQQIVALEKGIITTTNFDIIMAELETVNAERKRKIENNEPIYGPVQFTSRTYFFHVFDKMVIELKSDLAKNELKLQNQDSSVITNIDKNYDKYINKLMNTSILKLNTEAYEKIDWN